MVRDEFDFGFAVQWMRKDLGICIDEAHRNGAALGDHEADRSTTTQRSSRWAALGGIPSSLIRRLELVRRSVSSNGAHDVRARSAPGSRAARDARDRRPCAVRRAATANATTSAIVRGERIGRIAVDQRDRTGDLTEPATPLWLAPCLECARLVLGQALETQRPVVRPPRSRVRHRHRARWDRSARTTASTASRRPARRARRSVARRRRALADNGFGPPASLSLSRTRSPVRSSTSRERSRAVVARPGTPPSHRTNARR